MFLDTVPLAPSPHPMTPMLSPTVSGLPLVRRMYVEKTDVDPPSQVELATQKVAPVADH